MVSIKPVASGINSIVNKYRKVVASQGASIPSELAGSGVPKIITANEKIQQLASCFSMTKHKLNIKGKDFEVIKFEGSRMGSNPGYWIKTQLGNLAYVKSPGYEQASSEVLSSKLYELAGIRTPDLALASSTLPPATKYGHSTPVREVVSKYLPIERNAGGADAPLLREGFGADCWLANWDALKTGNCAIAEGKAVRMDVGGSLLFRAQGGRKGLAFSEDVQELSTFFDPKRSQSYRFIKDMTQQELVSSLSKVAKLSDDAISQIVHSSEVANPEFLTEMLIARKNYIAKFLTKCKYTAKKDTETMQEFVARIQATMPKTEYQLPYDKMVMSSRVRPDLPKGTTMAECLTPSQKRFYDESYMAYKASRGQAIAHNANDVLTSDNMLHVASTSALDSILQKGIVTSNCFATPVGKGTGMETLTPMCADFWDVKEAKTIKDYFARRPLSMPNGENRFLPNVNYEEGGRMVFVVNKKAVNETVMKNSFNVYPRQKNGIMYKDGNMDGHSYPTHRAVPFGVPANAIDRIILKTEAYSPDEIKSIMQKVKQSGLDIKIYDIKGKCLFANNGLKTFSATVGAEFETMLTLCKFTRLPLKYSREKFINDIGLILDRMPESKRAEFLAKFNLKLGNMDIDGIPNIRGFQPHTQAEAEMVTLIEKFYSNGVVTQNDKARKILDSLLDEFPEFAMIVGKPQHGTHAYTVDIHSIKLLQTAIKNNNYAKLSPESKEVLKLSALFHDFGKLGNTITPGHAKASKIYAEQILAHYDIPESVKARVLNIIEHHHWFEAYNKKQMTPQEFAKIFPTRDDRFIAMLFAKGDFESVNPTFHLQRLEFGKTLTPEQYEDKFREIMNDLLRKIK